VPDYDFDLFTIGAGSGGVAASRRAASYGARVAVCEESRVGGTCVIRGCVPKKILVYGSHYKDELDDAKGFGWTINEASFDWPKLIAAKSKEVDRLNGIYIRMLRDAGASLIEGRAILVDPHTVKVGGKSYTAKHILVATGARPFVPTIPGAEHGITSNEALELPELPRRLAIVGGGYIGVELAGVFNSLGAKVTMLIRGETVLRGFDDDIRAMLMHEMARRGVDIRPDTGLRDIQKTPSALDLLIGNGDSLEVDALLFATGRIPNTKGMGLEDVGIELDKEGAVVVDDDSKTSLDSIYAIGDCTNRLNLTPVAIAEGRAFAESMFNANPIRITHKNVPSAVFSQPPVATVGLSEEAARVELGEIDVYVTNFRALKHALTGREERTMMKLVVERSTDRVVGVHMVGADTPEILQGVAIAVRCGATKAQFDSTIGIHPTAAEELVSLREKRPEPKAHLSR
jgi:glutathione reductase (NADPH)